MYALPICDTYSDAESLAVNVAGKGSEVCVGTGWFFGYQLILQGVHQIFWNVPQTLYGCEKRENVKKSISMFWHGKSEFLSLFKKQKYVMIKKVCKPRITLGKERKEL